MRHGLFDWFIWGMNEIVFRWDLTAGNRFKQGNKWW
jgi:hypothetical protein